MTVVPCARCEGKGWYWRVPQGFNPFNAGGFNTARAMYKVDCSCPPRKIESGANAAANNPALEPDATTSTRTLVETNGGE